MKILLLLIALISLIGCASKPETQYIYETVEVNVPVPVVPKFNIPEKPIVPIDYLTKEDKDDHNVIGKAYVISVKELRAHIDQLHNLLEGIKKGETD